MNTEDIAGIADTLADAVYSPFWNISVVFDGTTAFGTGTVVGAATHPVLIHVNLLDSVDVSLKLTSTDEGHVVETVLPVRRLTEDLVFDTGYSLKRHLFRACGW